MSGFIRGLFGRKSETTKTQGSSFYLDPDSAKSLGDIEYMRKPLEVKKSFPKMSGGKPFEAPKATAKPAMEMTQPKATESPAPEVKSDRRRADSSLDMFRNMARDLKK
ncbi:MAG: hypothetical protein P5702_06035 [Limnospira sp. PMC 1291.21]|uniref:Uncharacterized protein n=3 Tax=Limnospira TaxID=2596745 RepID=A0A9P1KKA1_9CYAN|nr:MULTISPECIES: hypothetical protein [Limnospira]EKD09095.1 hypothetical protein SPLC1_S204960 [Arthrospira platensis C1]MDC0836414.1 hypothetical protein [Limnoraphis robusta]MDT9181695.1 hypothetical protein [Limnospira sp. PMC 289.06]MDY7052545.1 hypothetical protein [Limnospira fusiformis LS22]QJB24527.1 hypothetical protein HFV01_00405 [Limnospira fusiformis SAG 85.79]RAQ46719.1 hypothetical protein B9S53_06120 [Arthrospira sp. O9.13F]